MKIRDNQNVILISAYYRVHETRSDEFVAHLYTYLERIHNKDVDFNILVGDFNIDILDETDNISMEYLNVLHEFGYTSRQ